MYLSRLTLNPRSRQVQSTLARPHQMHRAILAAFPKGDVGRVRTELGAAGVLYRLDEDSHTRQLNLLIQSQQEPDWLKCKLDLLDQAVKEIDLRFQMGQQLAFRLLANPTKRLGNSFGKDQGKRIGLYKLEEQEAWIKRKGCDHGFGIITVLPTHQTRIGDFKKGLKFFSVQFDGTLQVTDPDKFLATIHNGVGSGKAFGFGLLSVAPAR